MAPTEATLLSTFLLPPAPLPNLISLAAFSALFPSSQRTSPQIKALYRDLQRQRGNLVDTITANIQIETKKGVAQRRAVVRVRRDGEREEMDEEVMLEKLMMNGEQISNVPRANPHSLKSILPELETAAENIEDEIRKLEEESAVLLEEMQNAVGGLSDLRYGRFANGQLREQVIENLERLEASCSV